MKKTDASAGIFKVVKQKLFIMIIPFSKNATNKVTRPCIIDSHYNKLYQV